MPNYFDDPKLQDYARQMEAKYNLPVGIMDTLIKTESGGAYGALSNKGAAGLTQLMPGTAKEMGVKNISDPYQNIEGGAKYFGQQMKNFGDPVLAAAAYNGGPGVSGLRERDINKLPQETYDYMSKFVGYRNQSSSPTEIQLTAAPEPAPEKISLEQAKALGYVPPEPAPEKISLEQAKALGYVPPEPAANADKIANRTWGEVPGEAVSNIIPSASNLVKNTLSGIAQAALHPINTGQGLVDLIQGTIERNTPMSQDYFNQSYKDIQKRSRMVQEVKDILINRYGSEEAIKNTLATDPVGVLSDITGAYKTIIKPAAKLTKAGISYNMERKINRAGLSDADYGGKLWAELNPLVQMGTKIGETISKISEHPVGQFAQSPVSETISGLFSNVVGPGISKSIEMANRGNLAPGAIKQFYDIGRGFTPEVKYSPEISLAGKVMKEGINATPRVDYTLGETLGAGKTAALDMPLIPNIRAENILAGAIPSAAAYFSSPLALGLLPLLSPKLATLAAGGTGLGVRGISELRSAYNALPYKGILSDYINNSEQPQY